jgi:hypothetical protein
MKIGMTTGVILLGTYGIHGGAALSCYNLLFRDHLTHEGRIVKAGLG